MTNLIFSPVTIFFDASHNILYKLFAINFLSFSRYLFLDEIAKPSLSLTVDILIILQGISRPFTNFLTIRSC